MNLFHPENLMQIKGEVVVAEYARYKARILVGSALPQHERQL